MATITVKITNKLQTKRTLFIEPWASEYALPPGKTLEVDEKYITFWPFGSQDAMVDVLENGRPI